MSLPIGIGIGSVATGTGPISVVWPTHTTGDLGTLVIHSSNQTVATPSGWTEYPNSPIGQGTAGAAGATRLTVFYKYATSASEPNVSIADSGDHTFGFIIVNRGVDPNVPYDFTSASTSSGTSLTLPTGTTASGNRHIIQLIGTARDASSTANYSGWANGALTSVIERKDQTFTTGTGGGFGMVTGDFAAGGALGNTTVTAASGDNVAMFTIALQPPAVIDAQPASWSWSPVDITGIYNQVLNAEPETWSWTPFSTTLTYTPNPSPGTGAIIEFHAQPEAWNWQFYNTGPYRETTISTQIEYYPGQVPHDVAALPSYIHRELLRLHAVIARIAAEKQDA